MGENDLKVTDKRMFTADGQLREEYRHLDDAAAPESASSPAPAAEEAPSSAAEPATPVTPAAAPEEPPRAEPAVTEATAPAAGAEPEETPRLEIPGTPEGLGAPSFLDLVTLLAEPIALYLGDVELPDGQSAENLDMARLHIDLLDVLRTKTAGNLDVGESRLLEDLLYRCRLRYVQKRG